MHSLCLYTVVQYVLLFLVLTVNSNWLVSEFTRSYSSHPFLCASACIMWNGMRVMWNGMSVMWNGMQYTWSYGNLTNSILRVGVGAVSVSQSTHG